MGGPLSGTLANIYLGFMERRVITIPQILLYNRYMDDILVICNYSDQELEQFINQLHSAINLKITASYNKEAVNFLDLSIFLSLRNKQISIQPFSRRASYLPVPSLLSRRNILTETNIIKSQVLRIYRQTTDSQSFSSILNKFLSLLLSNAPHKRIRKKIFKFLMPIKISTHKWTVKIPLCSRCTNTLSSRNLSIRKILKIDNKYLSVKEPINCSTSPIHLISLFKNSQCHLQQISSLHSFMQTQQIPEDTIFLPIGQLEENKLQRFLVKHPSIIYLDKENLLKSMKKTRPCYLYRVYKRQNKVYGVKYATKKTSTFSSMFNKFKKVSRQRQ
jgi:hypothetical protein